ncbi:MAG: IclR family transcriptional regulator [Desulfotignum sp.]|nr:IclR family transcriptional regulator [Desulfotignum sp.]MCF8124945.1 IclR family transcriptional regulator [Desulfotignum sp.]
MTDKKYYTISTLQRGLDVMEILAKKNGLTITELANELGINRSASHRFLATLEEKGYVTKTKNKRYYLTFKITQIGMKVANDIPLRKVARPYLQEVAYRFRDNVTLGYWDAHKVINLDKIDNDEVMKIDPGIGSFSPGHCTALGKAILAYLPGPELDSYLASNPLTRYTEYTITDRHELDTELFKIRKQAFSVDNQERAIGLRCVAVPVFDYTAYICCAISVSALEINMPDKRILEIKDVLCPVGLRLSRKLGAPESVLKTVFNC